MCISSGLVAASEVKESLEAAWDSGEKALTQFINERLVLKTVDVFAPIKKQQAKSFATPQKSKSSTHANKVKNDRSTFARMLVVANHRKIDLKSLLTYSLSSVSLPLANADGSGLNKVTKSDLLKEIEQDCGNITLDIDSLDNSALVIDAMAIVQAMPRSQIPTTFGELLIKILHIIEQYSKAYKASRVDFVGDRYFDVSIKNYERLRRTHGRSQITVIYSADQPIPKQ